MKHTLEHALNGCFCRRDEITQCVMCEKALEPTRTHIDTCGQTCYYALLRKQRDRAYGRRAT